VASTGLADNLVWALARDHGYAIVFYPWPTDPAAVVENRANNLHRRYFMPTKQDFSRHCIRAI